MSQVTRVDVPAVISAADDLDAIADKFEAAVAEIKRIAAELAGCWGDDEFGLKFAQGYLPYAEDTLDNADLTVGNLQDIGKNLREIVRLFQEVDREGGHVLELEDP